MKQGDKLIFSSRDFFINMTIGKTYTVLEFDPNNGTEWPKGCFGAPMVLVHNDKGQPSWWRVTRFKTTTPTRNNQMTTSFASIDGDVK